MSLKYGVFNFNTGSTEIFQTKEEAISRFQTNIISYAKLVYGNNIYTIIEEDDITGQITLYNDDNSPLIDNVLSIDQIQNVVYGDAQLQIPSSEQ